MIKISSTAHLNTLCIIEWAMVTEQGVDKTLNWNLQGIMNDRWKGLADKCQHGQVSRTSVSTDTRPPLTLVRADTWSC